MFITQHSSDDERECRYTKCVLPKEANGFSILKKCEEARVENTLKFLGRESVERSNDEDRHEVGSSPVNANAEETMSSNMDVVQLLENQQLMLINQLNEFIQRLNAALSNTTSRKRKSPEHTEVQASAQYIIPKEKVQKVSSGSRTAFSFTNGFPESVIVGQSLRPCLPPSLADFIAKKFPKLVSINAFERDRCWLTHLSNIAANRSVTFKGDLTNTCASRSACTVEVHFNVNGLITPVAVVDGVELHGRVVVWKLLGALIGIYPAERGHAVISAGIDRWLLLANQVVEGRINGERACRCVNPALSRSDFLASGSVATMADVIMKAAVDKNGICFPNNVEMWLARVGQAMAVC
ncbi:hypothetical protein Tcan_02574 [Toxocara canis]|uniref:Uncharacterized protein n=1 Tax=Toxocara canis TaxID=6265 RepID=A0A0B2UIX4_TOXCA|nr:hypothetical protein Tcan_02574 [Toxocara canis]